jgi:hypothetical protein
VRLPQAFQRLGVRFDVERMREEIERMPAAAWAAHPNDIAGNSSLRLVSVNGGQNDDVNGRMAMTPPLANSPYLRQILASFGVVWGRSRLMRLAPGATVPEHADINYHWFSRVRVHIPIVTEPGVRFYCGGESVHMGAGEAWLFDNWRLHRVENASGCERIHLVADTSGSSSFWQFVANSRSRESKEVIFAYDPQRPTAVMTEQTPLAAVMNPAEVEMLIRDLRLELIAEDSREAGSLQLARYHAFLENFCKDWRQLYLLYGAGEPGWSEFAGLRDGARALSKSLGDGLVLETNRVAAHLVLEGRVLRPMLTPAAAVDHRPRTDPVRPPPVLQRPVFIVAAPRSGSTLLFETLAASDQLVTVGGEAHWLVESIEELRVGAPGVDSNRLSADAYSVELARRLHASLSERLVDPAGRPADILDGRRFLEKTPKNALRIPLFSRVFPDAQFIFLWRDPRENLSSLIEAWRSGDWQTYRELDGFEGPWSMVLPPGWRALSGRPLEEIAAFQWDSTNRIVRDDLAMLPPDRWTSVEYAELIDAPRATVERLCAFLGLDVDPPLRARIEAPLPQARYTQTPAAADKWRRNASAIERVLPRVASTWERLRAMR